MTIDRRKLLGLGAGVAGAGLTGFLPKVLAWFKPAALLGRIERVIYTPGPPTSGEFEDLPANLVAHGPIDLEFDFEPTIEQGMAAIEGNQFRVQFPDSGDWVFSGYVTNWNVHPIDDDEPDELGLSVSIQPTGVRFD